jgi:hypothetical protein
MWKKVLIGAAVVALAGTTIVYAQHRPFAWHRPHHAFVFNTDDLPALLDARVAALHAGLRLTPDQDKNWSAFEDAYRGVAKLRLDRLTQARGTSPNSDDTAPPAPASPPSLLDRLERRAEALTQRGAALKKLADATAPLYNSLDEGQKRRFNILASPMGPRRAHLAWNDRRHGDRSGWFHRFDRGGDGGPDGMPPDSPRGPMMAPERLKWATPDAEDL